MRQLTYKLTATCCLVLFSLLCNAQTEYLNFSGTGDLEVSLGRYRIGNQIEIQLQIGGPWAEDGGIYQIVGDWNQIPRVAQRVESNIQNRIKFYAHIDPQSAGYCYLFATWVNVSPSKGHSNTLHFQINSLGDFDTQNQNGVFANAQELETVLSVNAQYKNVSIGSVSAPSDYKFAVAGKGLFEEVQVSATGATPWPDYVFSKDYPLTPLPEIKTFVEQNHHLPDVPSAETVKKKGVNLGEMNAILLRKIEELTLHLIELKETNESYEKRLKQLEK